MRAITIVLMMSVIGCSKQPKIVLDTPENFPAHFSNSIHGTWPPSGYDRVIGYRFDFPEIDYSADILYCDSTKKESWINQHKLDRMTVAKKQLTTGETDRLLKATFSEHGHTGYGACYQPHHIFIFYSKDGSVTHGIEVCFGCHNIGIAPRMPDQSTPSMNLAEAAQLCKDLGLWFHDQDLTEYLTQLESDTQFRKDLGNDTPKAPTAAPPNH